MGHLRKDANGHLLKTTSGHLVHWCGETRPCIECWNSQPSATVSTPGADSQCRANLTLAFRSLFSPGCVGTCQWMWDTYPWVLLVEYKEADGTWYSTLDRITGERYGGPFGLPSCAFGLIGVDCLDSTIEGSYHLPAVNRCDGLYALIVLG